MNLTYALPVRELTGIPARPGAVSVSGHRIATDPVPAVVPAGRVPVPGEPGPQVLAAAAEDRERVGGLRAVVAAQLLHQLLHRASRRHLS